MTPAEIRDKKFVKGVGGYKIEEVQHFLNQVAQYVESLEEEQAELEGKMEVLADKLEQYREDEESLRAALIGAQKLGQSVVRESQKKAEAIIAQAVSKAEDMVRDAQTNIDKEALALKKMQRDVAGFREQIIRLYSNHLEMIKTLPDDDDLPPVEIAQINYTPPTTDAVDMTEIEARAEQVVSEQAEDEEEGAELQFSLVGGEEAPEAEPEEGDDAAAFPKRKKRYKQLGEFFGEDKPVQRQ